MFFIGNYRGNSQCNTEHKYKKLFINQSQKKESELIFIILIIINYNFKLYSSSLFANDSSRRSQVIMSHFYHKFLT